MVVIVDGRFLYGRARDGPGLHRRAVAVSWPSGRRRRVGLVGVAPGGRRRKRAVARRAAAAEAPTERRPGRAEARAAPTGVARECDAQRQAERTNNCEHVFHEIGVSERWALNGLQSFTATNRAKRTENGLEGCSKNPP
jgi:hypothetical protein